MSSGSACWVEGEWSKSTHRASDPAVVSLVSDTIIECGSGSTVLGVTVSSASR